ncbi:T9SS type A sorting domain-containing protein [Reichenbachiella sp.]|uniref:T9SS type A sorting domain-containing protein n=1 Tax=Reichenbachiella sp. TaxID=2184521 RepID=UPI0032983A41
MKERFSLLIILLLSLSTAIQAQITSNGSGKWHQTTTWVGGVVPTSTDAVIIAAGHTVTYNALHPSGGDNDETIAALTINGTLEFPFAATADDVDLDGVFILTVTGTTTISGTGTLGVNDGYATGANRTHQLNLEGTLSNAGTLDLVGGSSSRIVNTDFRTNTFNVSGAGTYTFWNVDIDNGGTVTFDAGNITIDNTIDLETNSTLVVNGSTLTVGPAVSGAFEFNGANSAFTISGGATVNIGASIVSNVNAVYVDATGCTLTIDNNTGNANFGNAAVGDGRFGLSANGTNFTFNQQNGTTTIGDNFTLNAAAELNLNVSGGELQVGVGNTAAGGTTFRTADAISLTGGHLNFGEVIVLAEDLNVNGATLSFNTNQNASTQIFALGIDVDLNNTSTLNVGYNLNVRGSLTLQNSSIANIRNYIEIDGTLNIQGNGAGGSPSTLNTGTRFGAADNLTNTILRIDDNGITNISDGSILNAGSTMNGAISALAFDMDPSSQFNITNGHFYLLPAYTGVNGTNTQDLININDGAIIDFDEGTFQVLEGITDANNLATNRDLIDVLDVTDADGGNGQIQIGGGAGTANFHIAQNLAAQVGTPRAIDAIQIAGEESRFIVGSNADVKIGGGNVGRFRITNDLEDGESAGPSYDVDYHLQINGGAVDIAASLIIGEGAGVQITGGTTNIGLAASNGANDVIYANDPDGPSIFEVSGGTVNIGDGNCTVLLGDGDATPAFGDLIGYNEFEISGGIVTINGRLYLRDQNSRLLLNGGTLNMNAQSTVNLNEDSDNLILEEGIVLTTAATDVYFLNPHSAAGLAETLDINGNGTGNGQITGSATLDVPVDFSNVTWHFGDGIETKSGSSNLFRLNMANGHTSYGSFVINNPSGVNREVLIETAGRVLPSESITITAGSFDIGSNIFNDDGDGSNFSIGANATLKLNSEFPGSTTPYTTYTVGAGSTIDYNGTATIANAQIPDGTALENLTVSGSGTKTLNSIETINGTVTLTSGTLATGTNMTLSSGSTISRSAGTITGTIQGANPYTVEYTGLSKSIDDTTDPEWSGSGQKNLIINLDANENLTLINSSLSLVDLTITQGNLTDANAGFIHSVSGNVAVNTAYTGLGNISINGGSSTHTLSSSATATFSNLTIDDPTYNVTGDLDMTITGTLTLTNGLLDVTSGKVTIASGASISGGSSTSYVAFNGTNAAGGMVHTYGSSTDSKTFPIGTSTLYTPATITLTAATGFGDLTIVPVNNGSPFSLDGTGTLDLDYHWLVTTDGSFTGITANHTYNYDESDVRGVEGNYISARYNVSSPDWANSDDTASGTDGVNTTTNTITLTGVDYLEGHLTAGESDEFSGVITTFYPRSDVSEPVDWNTGSNWTNTDGGTTPINRTPGTNSPVIINRIVRIANNGMSAGSINIAAPGTLILDEDSGVPSSGHTLGTVSGAGLLRIISEDATSPTFPNENGGNWSSFLSTTGGTVEYSGDGSYTLPSNVSSYRNLTITSSTGSTTKTLGDVDITIHNDFMLSGPNTNSVIISDATNGNLTIGNDLSVVASNTLQFQNTNNRAITVGNDITVAGGLNVTNSGTAAHTLSLSGTLTSTGTVDFNTGGSTVDVTFNGASNEKITGAGSVDFNRLIVNKGSDQSSILEADITTLTITDTGADINTSVELQNGTFTISTGGTFTLSTNGDFTIPATSKLYLNLGTPTVQMTSASAGTLQLYGGLQVSSGIMNVGNQTDQSTDNSIRYDGTSSEIIVDGGILNVGGSVRPIGTNTAAVMNFTLSSGTVSLARNTTTNQLRTNGGWAINDADFAINNSSSSFTMSGGTLEIIRPKNGDGKVISISALVSTYSVTGGTVNILRNAHDAFSVNNTNLNSDIGIYSAVPFWNLQIGDGDYAGDIGNARDNNALDIRVLNDFTLNIDNTNAGEGSFDLHRVDNGPGSNNNGTNLEVGGNFTITDGSFSVNNNGSDGTTTFNGSGLAGQTSPQVVNSNGETLGDIVINSTSGSVDLGGALSISGDWTYATGSFNQSANMVTMTNANAVATTINGNASFEDLTLDNTANITLSSGDVTIISGGSLTLNDDVIFDIGENGLIIQEESAGAITFAATADATNMIRVAGTITAKGITREYPTGTTSGYLYPFGTNIAATDYYTPAQIDITTSGGANGNINVTPISAQHPLAEPTSTALDYYWKTRASGFDGNEEATHIYTYALDALAEGGNDVGFIGSYNASSPTFSWDIVNQNAVLDEVDGGGAEGVITFTSPGVSGDVVSGDFTGGLAAAFPAITVFYTLRDGDWNNTTAGTTPWTNDACGGGQTEVTGVQPASDDPVVVCGGNTVTITTTTGLNATAIEIAGTLTSQVADLTTIGNIDGTGTLAFNTIATTPIFGSLSSTFIGAAGGTVNYGGSGAYTLPAQSTYNNLIISNANTTTLATNATINGDATFNGSRVDMGSFTISDADNGGTFTLGSGTTLRVESANNFPDNFGTYTLDAASTVDYRYSNASAQTIVGGLTYGNLTLTRTGGNPAQKSMTGDITVLGNLSINYRSELLTNNYNITLEGNWTRDDRTNTDFEPGIGTVTLTGTNNQTLQLTNGTGTENFYNLTVNKASGTVDFGSNITGISVDNDLIVTSGTLDMGSDPLTVTGNTSTAASGVLNSTTTLDLEGNLTNAGTIAVASTISLNSNFSNTGTYTTTGNTLLFDNVLTAQSISGNATNFNNITVAKASGQDLTLNAATTIDGILALQNEGNVVLSSGNLTISTTGSITGSAGGSSASDFSATRMIRTSGGGSDPLIVKNASASADWDLVFPIGVDNSGNQYTPVTVDATNENITAGTLSIRSVNGTSTTESISGSAVTLNRHFDFNLTGLTGAVVFDVLFQYGNTDVQGDEGTYISAYSNGAGWTEALASQANVNAGANQFGASAALDGTITISTNGNLEWIAGNNDLIFPHLYTYTSGTGDWNTASDWSLSTDGSTSDGFVPTSANAVTILSGETMTMDNNTNSALSIEVNGTLNLAATTGHSLGNLTGTGILQIESTGLETYVNTGAGSTFLASGGGTVQYGGNAAYTLPAAIDEYQNLIIIGGTQNTHDKEIGINTIVYGDLTITTVDLENTGSYELEVRGGLSATGNLEVANGTFVWANTATASLSSNIVFGVAGNLVLDNFGEKDLAGTLNVSNLTLNSSSGIFDANSQAINITGNWDNKAAANLLSQPGITTFNSGGAQQIDGNNTFGITNISTASTMVTVASGTQSFSNTFTVDASTTFDIGSNTIRLAGTFVRNGTFAGASGRVVYTSATDPETQATTFTVGTLEIDKGAATNTFDNNPATVSFTNLIITSGEYDGPNLNVPGDLTISSSGMVDLSGITTVDINGNFNNAATLNMSALTSMNIAGDFNNTGTFTAPTTIIFDGASPQALNNTLSATNLTKTGGGDLTLNDDLNISGTLTLTSGHINTSAANLLTLIDGTSATINPTGSASSHIVGPMAQTIATTSPVTRGFPLGDGTNYRPIELDLTQTAATSTTYTAELFSGAPTPRTPLGTIDHVSLIRYYNVTASNSVLAAASGNEIRIEYGSDDKAIDESELLVAKSDGSGNWLDLGGFIVSGDATSGVIRSTADFNTFSDVVLASTLSASLPIELLSFEGRANAETVELQWSTSSEINNDHFEIERSADGEHYQLIGKISGTGNSNQIEEYSFVDEMPLSGLSYYRLKQVDFDGTSEIFNAIAIEYIPTSIAKSSLYPNPTSSQNINLRWYSSMDGGQLQIAVYDLLGQLVQLSESKPRLGQNNIRVRLDEQLKPGIYQMLITEGIDKQTFRLVIE